MQRQSQANKQGDLHMLGLYGKKKGNEALKFSLEFDNILMYQDTQSKHYKTKRTVKGSPLVIKDSA